LRETDTFKVYAQNNYIAPLTKVVLIAKTEDEGIQVSISPEMVARLNPGERTEFTVTLDTKDKQARDLNVDFAIDARELKMRPIQDPTDEELRDVLKTTYLCGSASDRPEKSSHLHFAERRLPEPAANQTKYRRSSGGHLLKSHGETNNDGNRESREKPPELGVMPGRRRRKSAPIAAFHRTVGSGPPIAFTRRTSCKAKLDEPRYRSRSSQTRTTRTPKSRPENRKTRGTDVRNVS